ncbi:unnamed protein product [Dracunculus medinensis]|uniref:Neur_chan_LBD domain-containing protein n=1 Tax=Dracunculus medinensis TaxID=318479 RepID=A0A0N4UE45_DRAME|nr:unnamed protein product [Dracunculus medinensis]
MNRADAPIHYRLYEYLMKSYNPKLLPIKNSNSPVTNHLRIDLYQIIEVVSFQDFTPFFLLFFKNFPLLALFSFFRLDRYCILKIMLSWNRSQFDNITMILLPHQSVWYPDTTLYNSLEMDDANSKRMMKVKIISGDKNKPAIVELLYPSMYKFSCMLNLRFFPYDIQNCEIIFGSWTHDNKAVDYEANSDGENAIGSNHLLENEEWQLLGSQVEKKEVKYECCVNNYTLLVYKLHIRRKPLFYLVNLVAPTSFITLIAIFGFFSTPTINDIREEKISLGITTLLSMSILILMVSDKMPSTSSFIPLIGWFYFSMMLLISAATLAATVINSVQKKGTLGNRPSEQVMYWVRLLDSQLATPANLAQLEYDWFAAVIERFCLLVFFIFFSLMSFGINALGLYYWQFTKIQ